MVISRNPYILGHQWNVGSICGVGDDARFNDLKVILDSGEENGCGAQGLNNWVKCECLNGVDVCGEVLFDIEKGVCDLG